MSRPGVTYLEVANVAQQLMVSGQEPTIERIRAHLKTGSNSTIGAHLRNWREKQDPLQQLATKEKIPDELIVLLKGLWERVMSQAEERVEVIKNDTQQALKQHNQTIQELEQANARLQQSENQLKQTSDGLAQEKLALEQIITVARTEIVALQIKQDGLLQQLADKQTRVEELHKQNRQTQANLEHYRAASLEQRQLDQQRAEQQQRELTQTVQQLKLENESLRQQKIDLQPLQEQLQSAQNNMQHKLTEVSLHAESVSAQLIEANKALTQKSESQQHWQIQHEKLYAKWEEQMNITNDLKTRNAVLLQEIVAMKIKLDDIGELNKALAHDKWILGQEKAQLFGQLKQLQTVL